MVRKLVFVCRHGDVVARHEGVRGSSDCCRWGKRHRETTTTARRRRRVRHTNKRLDQTMMKKSNVCLLKLPLLVVLALLLLPTWGFPVWSSPMRRIGTSSTAFAQESSPKLPTRRPSPSLNSLATGTLAALDGFFRTCPYTAAALTCGIKASAADLIAQQSSPSSSPRNNNNKEVKQQTDLKRNVAFGLYGALYQGALQEYIYNHLYPIMFGAGTSLTVVLTKVLFDLLVQTTLVTLPVAYLTKALVYQYKASKALSLYWNDILHEGLLKKYFLLWGPVQCLTFSVVPEHFRVSFIAFVSFFWLIVLSKLSSKAPMPKEIVLKPVRIQKAAAVVGE